MLKLINDKKVPLDKYNGLLNEVLREDDKLFHGLVVPVTFSKYILHQAHDALDHNGTTRTYHSLKQLYY